MEVGIAALQASKPIAVKSEAIENSNNLNFFFFAGPAGLVQFSCISR